MSEENVKRWRAQVEELRAGTSAQFDQEPPFPRWQRSRTQIELDVSESPWGGPRRARRGTAAVWQWWQEWLLLRRPSSSSTAD